MKHFKNRILSVLLFAFSILVIHDYIIVDASSKNMTSYTKSEKTSLDSTSKVHIQIHMSMDVPLNELAKIPLEIKNKKIFDYEISSISYVQSVLQRPPSS